MATLAVVLPSFFVILLVMNLLKNIFKEPLNNSSAAGRRIFCPIRAVLEMGNTQSIPAILVLSAETKSSAASSCRINQSFLKNKYAQAVLQGMKPCMVGIILSTGCYMTLRNCIPLVQSVTVDIRTLLITVILVVCMMGYLILKKRKLSPIFLIVTSAVLGNL